MNDKTTHLDWHPMDTDEELAAAIERVRAEVAKASAGLRQKQAQEDYAIGEWWTGHRRIEGEELEGIYRRAARRGNQLTDELILYSSGLPRPARAPLGITRKTTTPPRQCPVCLDTFGPRTAAQRYCTNRCARKAAKERAA